MQRRLPSRDFLAFTGTFYLFPLNRDPALWSETGSISNTCRRLFASHFTQTLCVCVCVCVLPELSPNFECIQIFNAPVDRLSRHLTAPLPLIYIHAIPVWSRRIILKMYFTFPSFFQLRWYEALNLERSIHFFSENMYSFSLVWLR